MTGSGSTTATGEVLLKGNAVQLDTTLQNTSRAVDDLTKKLHEVGAATDAAKNASERARQERVDSIGSTIAATNASTNLSKTYTRLGFAAHQLVAGTASFNTALQGVLGTLGPTGLAVGALVGVVWHFVDAEIAAADATKKATAELKKQREEAKRQSKIDYFEQVFLPEQKLKAEERTAVAALRETEDFLEEEAARARREVRFAKQGPDRDAAKRQLSEVMSARAVARAEVLKAEAEVAAAVEDMDSSIRLKKEAERTLRADRLRQIDDEDVAEEEAHKRKQRRAAEQLTDVEKDFKRESERVIYRRQLFEDMQKRVEGYAKRDREARDAADFKALDQRFEDATKRAAQQEAATRAAELERLKAQGAAGSIKDPRLAEIEQQRIEEQFQFQQQLETGFAQFDQAREMRHVRELQRLDEERAAREKLLVTVDKASKMAANAASQTLLAIISVTDARRQAERAARAQGKSDAEAAQAGKVAELNARASQLQGIRNMAGVRALEETAEGIASLASFDYTGAGFHFASAAVFGAVAGAAGARSRTLSDQASSMEAGGFSSGGAFGPGQAGGGGGGSTSAANGPSANLGPVPGSPTPQPRSGKMPTGNTTYIHVEHLHGKMDREVVRDISEQQRQLGYNGANFGSR
ncbi:MAG: hypothetical protein IPH07_24405 [Deltaproteobacteria bacterium]|nr:hypothetical protein [Deltaproteobacteria bacterium]